MGHKIYIVIWASYTEGDSYMYTECSAFTSKREARRYYRRQRRNAHDECKLGASSATSPSEEDDAVNYDIKETFGENRYEASSDAYEGYHVEVGLVEKELDFDKSDDDGKV